MVQVRILAAERSLRSDHGRERNFGATIGAGPSLRGDHRRDHSLRHDHRNAE